MFSQVFLSTTALLSFSTLIHAAPTPTNASFSTTTLLPLYVNGQKVASTPFQPPTSSSPSPSSPSPPSPFTYIDPSTNTNVTIVSQIAAVPSFFVPASDTQLFATFAQSAYANQSSSHSPSDSLPNDKLDIGAKLVNEPQDAGSHTVHVTVVRDPMTAKSPFTWAEGGVVVETLVKWSDLFAQGSFAGCAGVLVQSAAGDMVAQGSFCGAKA